jgi:hypothetical protein
VIAHRRGLLAYQGEGIMQQPAASEQLTRGEPAERNGGELCRLSAATCSAAVEKEQFSSLIGSDSARLDVVRIAPKEVVRGSTLRSKARSAP